MGSIKNGSNYFGVTAKIIQPELARRQKQDTTYNQQQKPVRVFNLKFHPFDFTFNMTTVDMYDKRKVSEYHVWFMVPYLEEENKEKGEMAEENKPPKEVVEKPFIDDRTSELIDMLKPMLLAVWNKNMEQKDFRT